MSLKVAITVMLHLKYLKPLGLLIMELQMEVTKYPAIFQTSGFGARSPDPNGNYTNPSSYFVEDGSYLKLKNFANRI